MPNSSAVNTSLVIPAFNEIDNIEPLFDAIDALPPGTINQVLLADNNSTDGTADAARRRSATVVHESQRGYGAACLKALDWLRANDVPDIIAFLDADLADDPAVLPRVLAPLQHGDADIVIGSRVTRAEPGALNLVQRFGNGLACRLIQLTTGACYTDLGPLRACRWDALERLKMADRTWGWTVEMQMKAATRGLRVVEVDVPYRRRRHGRSKISGTVRGVIAAGSTIILTIVALWWSERRRANRR